MAVGVALINPKFPRNVGNVIRACSNFQAGACVWTPERVDHPDNWSAGSRLPREERMKLYREVLTHCFWRNQILDSFIMDGMTPVAVEVRENAEPLTTFIHPENAIYVFGPEDGSLDRGVLSVCHRFVYIPSTSCLNLAAAVNVVLYDRIQKAGVIRMPRADRAYAEAEA
jgi:tRNA(Leu) C34 or U34 (ribose-2'-O)-methylase TrmL